MDARALQPSRGKRATAAGRAPVDRDKAEPAGVHLRSLVQLFPQLLSLL